MDTEVMLPYGDFDIEKITLFEYTTDELEAIQSYVEITRHIQEIQQLYLIFRYNQRILLSTYDLNNRDRIKRNRPPFETFDNRTELNALVISFISAGKTLIDSLTTCVTESEKNSGIFTSFKKFLTCSYDDSFSYRLLTRLRDFSQHGHLPVSVINDDICFDIAQILYTPHFNHNKSLSQEMRKFVDELLVINKTHPFHMFTLAVADYTVSVYRIYSEFYTQIEPIFLKNHSKFRELITAYPGVIKHEDPKFNGYLFYLIDNALHVINTFDRAETMFEAYKKEATNNYNNEQQEFDSFRTSIHLIPVKKS